MLDIEIEGDKSLEIELDIKDYSSGTDDYEKLNNIPTLNGVPIVGNINECDPTVPEWAKSANKPTYCASEVNAVGVEDIITIEELANLFKESEE
ncbi:MAG: hypothetical protein MSA91_04490 [Lachnobacterium sp.]|nr:hypothetical protein [Lachnobacterium sp.]